MEIRKFDNESLKEVYDKAKEMNLKTFTFENKGNIKQFFFTDGVKIGTCSASFGSVTFGSVHKPCRECGTGFGFEYDLNKTLIQNINYALNCHAPNWAKQHQAAAVKKYESAEAYINKESILRYYYF
jgi:hypothetical protein